MNKQNVICEDQTVHGEQAYVYGLKARAQRHHCLGYGTFSIDLDRLEHHRKTYSHRIRPITYTPLYVKATALAIERNPEANAILFKKLFGLRIVRFENVDVNLPITRTIGGKTVTLIGTVRSAAARTLSDIQGELAQYQKGPPEESFAIRRIQSFGRMPLWLARLIHWRMTWDPRFYIRNVGSCGVTFLDKASGEYMFPIGPTSVIFGIGGAHTEPVVREGRVRIGRVLKCSLMVDNYVVSGLTGASLVKDFKDLLETGTFIAEEFLSAPAPARQPIRETALRSC